MKNLPQPLFTYVTRFIDQYNALNISSLDENAISELIINNKSQLNNLLMSGLGASTLILRLGAVINLSKKLDKGNDDEDAVLMKQIIVNLRETLPSDTNWKTIWEITCDTDSKWAFCINHDKGKQSLMEKFVTFRNRYVHEIISLVTKDSKKIKNGIQILNEICIKVSPLFENTELKEINGEYNFIEKQKSLLSKPIAISLYPFIQKGNDDGLPYVFQGLYDNKKTAELISTFHGDVKEQEAGKHYDTVFNPMLKSLKGGAGRVFNHNEIIDYYSECFVGREDESNKIIKWAIDSNEPNNILPVYSQAGMGKGALLAHIIKNSTNEELNIPVLHHFCNSGLANNLHAILYHFILQGKKMQIWNLENEDISKTVKKLPSKYPELISLFQKLLDDFFKINRNNKYGNLIIIIDGLDEAGVAFSEYNIKDYFTTFDENGEVNGEWKSKPNIKWIFSFREGFYSFPNLSNILSLSDVQPLLGLSEESVESALTKFSPSKEFIDTVIERGHVS